jgi:hypothetical protein
LRRRGRSADAAAPRRGRRRRLRRRLRRRVCCCRGLGGDRLPPLDVLEYVVHGARHDARVARAAEHSVRLSAARLAVGEDRAVVALQRHGDDARRAGGVGLGVGRRGREHAVERIGAAPVGRVLVDERAIVEGPAARRGGGGGGGGGRGGGGGGRGARARAAAAARLSRSRGGRLRKLARVQRAQAHGGRDALAAAAAAAARGAEGAVHLRTARAARSLRGAPPATAAAAGVRGGAPTTF